MNDTRRRRLEVDVDGGQLIVERSGQGPSLLMVHGWALDRRMFDPQRDELEEDLETIVYDRRGFGSSSAPPDLRRETGDIVQVLDTLEVSQTHLLGMSQGGRIALRFAAEYPERLASLSLQGPVIDGFSVEEPEHERIPIAHYADLVRTGKLPEFRRQWRDHPMMSLDHAPDANIALVQTMLESYEGRDLAAFEPEQYDYEPGVLRRLAQFRQPVLLLTGARETAARKAQAEKLRQTFPDVREVILERSGHLSNLTEPQAYNAALRSFCLGVESGRG